MFTRDSPVGKRNGKQENDIFDISYYKALKKYHILLGLYPYKDHGRTNIIVSVIVIIIASLLIPGYARLCESIRVKDVDRILESLISIEVSLAAIIKILTMHLNRKHFGKLYDSVVEEWKFLEFKNELHLLDNITKQGSLIAKVYRTTLLSFMVIFLFVPLLHPLLDIVVPLNETRRRQQIFDVNYVVIDGDEYFYSVYIHLACTSIIIVLIIVAVDSIYMVIVHHNCGLFILCGYQLNEIGKKAFVSANRTTAENDVYKQFKHCVIMHNKAIQFFNVMENCSRRSMFVIIGLTMSIISVTAYQIVMYLDNIEQALRLIIFLCADEFHLLYISLPGQKLQDYSLKLSYEIYDSKWYQLPVKLQTMFGMIQMRSVKPCSLTAGGLYTMNIENYGNAFKTSVSYFMMLLSLRD